MKLFESILNSLLNESMGEAIVNPNDTSTDVFTCAPKNEGKTVIVLAKVGKDGVAKIAQMDNSLIIKQSACVVVSSEALNDENSEDYQKIIRLCNAVSKLGDFGQIDPNEVIKEAKFVCNQTVTKEKVEAANNSEDDFWMYIAKSFNEPRVQELLKSFHKYLPLECLDLPWSQLNIARILAQDDRRIKQGRPPATYVTKPDNWRAMNRRIKEDAEPFILVYPITHNGDPTNDIYDEYLTKSLKDQKDSILGGKSPRQYVSGLKAGGSKTLGPYRNVYYGAKKLQGAPEYYDRDVYYDIADTEVIPGLEDLWSDPERLGVVDNIRWVPTEAGMNKVAKNLGITKDELQQRMGGSNDSYAIKCYKALKSLCHDIPPAAIMGNAVKDINQRVPDVNALPTKADGTVDIDQVKDDVFNLAVAFLANKSKLPTYYAKPGEREAKARMIACLFVATNRIACVKETPNGVTSNALEAFAALKPEDINAEGLMNFAENTKFQYQAIFSELAKAITAKINGQQKDEPRKLRKINESVNPNTNDMLNSMYQFADTFLKHLGIDRFGNKLEDTDNAQEAIQMNEAKFYQILDKITYPNF